MKKLKMGNPEFKAIELAQAKLMGANILSGKRPKVVKLTDTFEIEIEKDYGEHNFDYLVDDNEIWQHVDIWGAPFCLTYDFGEV